MHLKKLEIQGYKNLRNPFIITFSKGLNVLVGENGSGKSAIIDAARLLLEDEFGRSQILDTDFNRPFGTLGDEAKSIRIRAFFDGLSSQERVAFLPWTEPEGQISLTLLIDNQTNSRGRYKRTLWGGTSRSSMFEVELFETINCIYLPPLRDAEAKLSEGKSSRLARLLKNLNRQQLREAKQNGKPHPLVQRVQDFNDQLATEQVGSISQANSLIRKRLVEALGSVFGQDTNIQFSETSFNRIVESLRLLFFPEPDSKVTKDQFRSLEENSLGYNNLLYLATVLAELTDVTEVTKEPEYLKLLLIEEPEAHLHPQLQIRLLKYLEKLSKEKDVQVIVTTHSPVLASSVSLDSLIHVSALTDDPVAIPLLSCSLNKDDSAFISRWLDVTKSTLLFARGVILVEGIAEAMVMPELAKLVLKNFNSSLPEGSDKLPESLEDGGISVINMNGIYFKYFMQLFADITSGKQTQKIPIRCSGLTDNDPPGDPKPTITNPIQGENPALALVDGINASTWARLYPGKLKTFEYDLAMEKDNLKIMIPIAKSLIDTDGPIKNTLEQYEKVDWGNATEINKSDAAFYLLKRIEKIKGEFSQLLASYLSTSAQTLSVPDYIYKAVVWACGGTPDDPGKTIGNISK